MSVPIALVIGALLAAAQPGHPLRDRADLSFSAIPLGTTRPPAELGLRELGEQGCRRFGECDWADAEGVRHYFWDGGELVVKSVRAHDLGDRPILALGIGRARTRAEVIAAVRAFLPEVALDCAGEEGVTLCTTTLDAGWLRLWFDASGRLTEVRLDARHFT